jgi:hypothetical protein
LGLAISLPLKYSLTLLLIVMSIGLHGQALELKLDGHEKGMMLTDLLTEVEKQQNVRFYYLPQWIEGLSVEESYAGYTLEGMLSTLLFSSNIAIVQMNEHSIVLVKNPAQDIRRREAIGNALRQQKEITTVLVGDPKNVKNAGQSVTLRGRVVEKSNNAAVVGAAIIAGQGEAQATTVTDANGNFEIRLVAGQHLVSCSFLNFEEELFDLSIYQDGELQIVMEEIPTLLDEVVIAAAARGQNTTTRTGQTNISVTEIKRAPAMLGEVDLVKQVQTLPGVTTAGEAAAGFNVRGGGVDQNLVLYDGVPVFNSSHAFGFFSGFNAEAIRDVTFYRGGIPAEYGGRVSSVLDIRSKEGDYEKWNAAGGIGLISTNLMANGPIIKGSTSIAVSGRWVYSDWLVNTIRTNYVDLKNASVFFYDGTVKVAHKFSQKTKLILSGYSSKDQFRLRGDSAYRWNNLLGMARLDHQFGGKLSMNLTASAGNYQYSVFAHQPETGFDLSYRMIYPSVKAAFNYQAGKHALAFGVHSTYYMFDPGKLEADLGSNVRSYVVDRQHSVESALYAGDAFALSEEVLIEAGARLSLFNAIGPATINLYEDGVPMDVTSMTGTLEIPKGEVYKTYAGVEPRASLRYSFSPSLSAKFGYNRMYQYLHLVTNTTAVTPVDIWQPSGYYFKPQVADQLSIGVFKDFKNKMYETFIEAYYKSIDNIVDFKDGARLILNDHLETDLLQGKGTAYGIEASVTKTSGWLSGTLNYTYSRSFREISGATDEESINKGEKYPSNFDQPHAVNMSWKYAFTRRLFLTGQFTYRTGRPITIPESGFVVDNITIASFSERNKYRVPDYHRLDLALVLEGNHRRKKILDGTWTFSVYNVYSRKNVYTVFFKDDGLGYLRPYALSIIGAALPSLSYSFKI